MSTKISELEGFYRFIRPSDLLGKYSLTSFKDKNLSSDSSFVSQLSALLIGTNTNQPRVGFPSLQEINNKIAELISKATDEEKTMVSDIIRLYSDSGPVNNDAKQYWTDENNKPITWNQILKSSQITKAQPLLGIIQSSSPFLTQNVRDIDAIAFFMNTIPTIELNRAVPFLDVNFQFSRPQNADEPRLRVPSQLKFLNGAIIPKNNSADDKINKASIDKQILIDGTTKQVFRAGTELFCSPQTLLNPNVEDNTSVRFVPVIDNFRPFMSIESFEITAAPTVGLFSYKTAKLSITLHDRSRLAEISDLVRPEVYCNTTLSISYGWSHPDKQESNNVYGILLNQMGVYNEKYGIVNCHYSFDTVGQVKITLQLAMKGTQELRVVKIIEDPEYSQELRRLEELQKLVADLRERKGLARADGIAREVRAYQILDVAESGQLTSDLNSKDIQQFIKSLRTAQGDSQDISKRLADALTEVFGGSDKTKVLGMKEKIQNTVGKALETKFNALVEGEDPFLAKTGDVAEEIKKYNSSNVQKGKPKAKGICSLAKIFLTFMGLPLQSLKNVNEIQFIFYQFNGSAGKLGNANIGSFPVEIRLLKKAFEDHTKQKGNAAITINEFMMLLQSVIINDPSSIGYGLKSYYSPRTDLSKEPELRKSVDKNKFENDLANVVKNHGSIKLPVVEAYIETSSGRPLQEGQLQSEKDQLDIMRVHVYDKTSTPYEPFLQLIKSQTGLQDIINNSNRPGETTDKDRSKKLLQNAIDIANTTSLKLEQDQKSGKILVKNPSNLQDMKDFISQVLPTITYGSNNTAVMMASLSTQQNQMLSTVQMVRSAKQNNAEPNGSLVGGIPLRTIPAQLDMTFHGCPLLNVNQQFFIDFKTGTTIDNIYLLSNLTHTIKQGSFTSTAKFTPLDAYGTYESIVAKVQYLADSLNEISQGKK